MKSNDKEKRRMLKNEHATIELHEFHRMFLKLLGLGTGCQDHTCY